MPITPTESRTRPGAAAIAGRPLRVLVADDHPVYREGIVRARVGSGRPGARPAPTPRARSD